MKKEAKPSGEKEEMSVPAPPSELHQAEEPSPHGNTNFGKT